MKKLIWIFIAPLLVVAACSRHEVIDQTYRWPVSGVPAADSLLIAFERARIDVNVSLDERSRIMAELCSVAALHPDNQLLSMRRLFIETCATLPTDPRGAIQRLDTAMQRFDSAAAPYDWHSLQSLQLIREKNIYRKYLTASDNVEYFKKVGAEMDMANNLMLKGNALCELSDTTNALECFNQAQEIFLRHDAWEALYSTKLNTLPLLKPNHQIELLDQLLQDTIACKYPKVFVPVCQTAYYITHSVEYLDRAISMANAYAPARGLLPVLASMKASYMAENGEIGVARAMIDSISRSENAYQPSTRYRVAIHQNLAYIYEAAGEKDSCISQLIEVNFWADSLQREANYRQIYGNEARMHIEAVQNFARLKHRTVIIWWIVSMLAVLLASIIFYRRKAEKRREEIRILDERIETQRRLNLAQESILNNDNEMVAHFETILKGITVQSLSPSEAIAKMRKILAEYHRKEESQKSFLTVTREIDNSFSQRLKADFPDISESQLRLASMIAAGMDSHQLASALNISAKSLYTSRYRLRTRLNLSKDASLEDFLRQYAS